MVILSELSVLFGLSIGGNLMYLAFPSVRKIVQQQAAEAISILRSDEWVMRPGGIFLEYNRSFKTLDLLSVGKLPKENPWTGARWARHYLESYQSRMDIILASSIVFLCGILTVFGVVDKLGWTPNFLTEAFSGLYFQGLAFGVALVFMLISAWLIIRRAFMLEGATEFINAVTMSVQDSIAEAQNIAIPKENS